MSLFHTMAVKIGLQEHHQLFHHMTDVVTKLDVVRQDMIWTLALTLTIAITLQLEESPFGNLQFKVSLGKNLFKKHRRLVDITMINIRSFSTHSSREESTMAMMADFILVPTVDKVLSIKTLVM